jgi:hypothetical protein
MKTQKDKAKPIIRFRRWSRAGYAVFCSLACTVTIGCLAVSISDMSLQKSVVTSNTLCILSISDIEPTDKSPDLLELESTLQNILEISLFEIKSDNALACYQASNIYFIHQNG